MMSKHKVQLVLDRLYEAISFNEGDEPNLDRLEELFAEEASLIEYRDAACLVAVRKSVGQHIDEFRKVLEDHPEIKNKGFMERELDNNIDICGPMASVRSRYLKRYFNGKSYIEKEGINCLLLAVMDDNPKIVAMGWYEPPCCGAS